MKYPTRILKRGEHYAVAMGSLVIRQEFDGGKTIVTSQIRRVVPSTGEELQIEIETLKIGEKRNTTQYTQIILPAEFADAFVKAASTVLAKGDR